MQMASPPSTPRTVILESAPFRLQGVARDVIVDEDIIPVRETHGVDARQFVRAVIHRDGRAESRRELGDFRLPAFERATHAEMADRFVQPGFANLDDRQGATTSGASVSRRVASYRSA